MGKTSSIEKHLEMPKMPFMGGGTKQLYIVSQNHLGSLGGLKSKNNSNFLAVYIFLEVP